MDRLPPRTEAKQGHIIRQDIVIRIPEESIQENTWMSDLSDLLDQLSKELVEKGVVGTCGDPDIKSYDIPAWGFITAHGNVPLVLDRHLSEIVSVNDIVRCRKGHGVVSQVTKSGAVIWTVDDRPEKRFIEWEHVYDYIK